MSKAFVTVIHFPITPIHTNYRQQLFSKLNRKLLMPRMSDCEDLWLDYTTEHPTQFDVVCYKFETREDAIELIDEFASVIAQEVTELIANNTDAEVEAWID
jgi:hypothetical protein